MWKIDSYLFVPKIVEALRCTYKGSALQERSLSGCRKSCVRDKYWGCSASTDQNPLPMNWNALPWFGMLSLEYGLVRKASLSQLFLPTVGERAVGRGLNNKDEESKTHFCFLLKCAFTFACEIYNSKMSHHRRTVNFIYSVHKSVIEKDKFIRVFHT